MFDNERSEFFDAIVVWIDCALKELHLSSVVAFDVATSSRRQRSLYGDVVVFGASAASLVLLLLILKVFLTGLIGNTLS